MLMHNISYQRFEFHQNLSGSLRVLREQGDRHKLKYNIFGFYTYNRERTDYSLQKIFFHTGIDVILLNLFLRF